MPSDLKMPAWKDARSTILQLGLATPKQSEAAQDGDEPGFGSDLDEGAGASGLSAPLQGGSSGRRPSAPPMLPDAVLRQCNRCHLCPEGELKTRKKAKHTLFRLGLATPKVAVGNAHETSEPRRVRFIDEMTRAPDAQQSPAAADTSGFDVEPAGDLGEMVGSISVELVGGETAPGPMKGAGAPSLAGGRELSPPPGLVDRLRPDTEAEARKGHKQALMRLGLVTPKAARCTRSVTFGSESVASPGDQESDQESTSASGSAEELGVSSGSEVDAAAERQAPGARSSDGSVMPVPPGLQPPPETPSHGSTLHRTGACQPCAWFWKPGSCQNGLDCSYCHLCPESELKDRKKSKHAQMRLGLVTPRVQHAKRTGGDSALSADAPEFMPTFFGPVTLRMGLATPKAPCNGPFDWQAPDLPAGKFGMGPPVPGGV
jgi:hypothetical protein